LGIATRAARMIKRIGRSFSFKILSSVQGAGCEELLGFP
jgi:hypothetical protein